MDMVPPPRRRVPHRSSTSIIGVELCGTERLERTAQGTEELCPPPNTVIGRNSGEIITVERTSTYP